MAQGSLERYLKSHRQMRGTIWAGLMLMAVLLAAYANSFQASWHYDDYSNIVENQNVRLTHWSWSQFRAVFAGRLNHLAINRPLAYLSFALNYYFGGLNVFGYHIVNFGIHWLTALFLFLFIKNTCLLPSLDGRYERHAYGIALLAALLWATHPIQVTAVTYVVQRMASMAGLFYIMAMYFYLKARRTSATSMRRWYFGWCALSTLCALLTKENAVLVIYALWLFDFLLIRNPGRQKISQQIIILLGLTLVIFLIAFLFADPGHLFEPFNQRPFTRAERLMTQPRVLFFYLYLIVFPMASYMGLLHDIGISRSLMTPWTTWLSIAGLLLILLVLCLKARKHPLLSFCGLFFLLNHLVEGSILNLELIYEHRNYIPSMMLFVPVAVAVAKYRDIFSYRRSFQALIAGSFIVLLLSQISTTYRYNKVYLSDLDTWSHLVASYPQLSLGHLNLGRIYWEAGLFEKANNEYGIALKMDRYNNLYQKGLVYYNLGIYQSLKKHNYVKALEFFDRALAIYPDAMVSREIAINRLKLERYQSALEAADAVLKRIPDDTAALMVEAQSLRFLNDRASSVDILERLRKRSVKNSLATLALIEIYAEMGRAERVDQLIGELFERNQGKDLKAGSVVIEQPELLPYCPDVRLLENELNSYVQRHSSSADP